MSKYSLDTIVEILDMVRTGEYTYADLGRQVGVTADCISQWRWGRPDFKQAFKIAEKLRLDHYKTIARESALKLVQGYEVTETTQVWRFNPKVMEMILVEEKSVTKHIQPSTGMTIFMLKNVDPENFQDKSEVGVSMPDIGKINNKDFQQLSTEEIKALRDIALKVAKKGEFRDGVSHNSPGYINNNGVSINGAGEIKKEGTQWPN